MTKVLSRWMSKKTKNQPNRKSVKQTSTNGLKKYLTHLDNKTK